MEFRKVGLDIPKVKFNGEKIDDLIGKCTKCVITSEIGSYEIVELKMRGTIEHEEYINTPFVYLEIDGKKYRLMEVVDKVVDKHGD